MRDALGKILTSAGTLMTAADHFDVEKKQGHANYVTNVDKQLQALLKEELDALLPGTRFIAEEQKNNPLTDAPTWIVDPLDGTNNFIHDTRASCISVALVEDRKPVVGCVYQPWTRELFDAELGKGARLNGRSIRASDRDMPDAFTTVGTSPYIDGLREPGLDLMRTFLNETLDIRRDGAAAIDLCYVACGRYDLYYELSLKPWDVAAGSLIVTEAGGAFEMPLLDGLNYDIATTMLAANKKCIGPARTIIRAAMQKYRIDAEMIRKWNEHC